MKYITIFLLFIFFSTSLEAKYFRTIQIATFNSTIAAENELKKLIESDVSQEIVALKGDDTYDYIVKKIGNYYVIRLEPFKNPKKIIKVKELIQKRYHDAYINKFLVVDTAMPVNICKQEKQKVEKVVQSVKIEKVKVAKITIVQTPPPVQKSTVWIFPFILAFLSFMITLVILLKYKKENSVLKEELTKLKESSDMNFDDIDFDDIDFEDIDFDDILDK